MTSEKLAKSVETLDALSKLYDQFRAQPIRSDESAELARVKIKMVRYKALATTIHIRNMLDELEKADVNRQIPFTFYISTAGGNTEDMFALYDVIKYAQSKGVIIKTVGIGKVFSAGVPLLAAGTPGYRYIGRNCRTMIHDGSISGDSFEGSLTSVKNEIEEIKLAKKKYYDILKNTTAINDKMIKQILKKRINHYFSSDEAVRLGIVDKLLGD